MYECLMMIVQFRKFNYIVNVLNLRCLLENNCKHKNYYHTKEDLGIYKVNHLLVKCMNKNNLIG